MSPPLPPRDASGASRLAGSIARVRRSLAESTDLKEVWDVFFETLVDDDEFHREGTLAEHPTLTQVVEAAVPRAISQPGRLSSLDLLHLPAYGLWHGMALFREAICTVLYFEADGRGLLAINRRLGDDAVHFARFNVLGDHEASFPMQGPRESV